jgi:hypothetical protein
MPVHPGIAVRRPAPTGHCVLSCVAFLAATLTGLQPIGAEHETQPDPNRHKQRAGSNAKRMPLDIELPLGSKTVRFGLDVSPWGSGKKNVELVITEGMFHAAKE